MANQRINQMCVQLINETRTGNTRLCTEKIPVEKSKGLISLAMIDAIAEFSETANPEKIIELIQKAKETNYVFNNEATLAVTKWIKNSNGFKFKMAFDVRRGRLFSIRIIIFSYTWKLNSNIVLTSSAKDVFSVELCGNGTSVSNKYLEAAKEIFTRCL